MPRTSSYGDDRFRSRPQGPTLDALRLMAIVIEDRRRLADGRRLRKLEELP